MARRNRDQNVPDVVVPDAGGKPAFPDLPDNSASRFSAPGLIKCVCVTKCYRNGLIRPGEIRYFPEVPEHFRRYDEAAEEAPGE